MARGIKAVSETEDLLCVPLEHWPAQDRALWERAVQKPRTPFDDDGARSRRRAITNRNVRRGYGRWLGFLRDHGLLDPAASPGSRITPERVRAYIDALLGHGDAWSTIAERLQSLRQAALVMNADQCWDWLQVPACNARRRSTPVIDKRGRMVPADALDQLGFDLRATAASLRQPGWQAVQYRDGLIISFLALEPLRLKNAAGLAFGGTLIEIDGTWHIAFSRQDTKTAVPIERIWPETLVEALHTYIAEWRPVLLARRRTSPVDAGDALWVSAEGTALSAKQIHHAIEKRTLVGLGRSINPHLFRDIAATTIAVVDPKHVRAAAAVLAHASLSMTEQHYLQAQSLLAQRNYVALVRSKRKVGF